MLKLETSNSVKCNSLFFQVKTYLTFTFITFLINLLISCDSKADSDSNEIRNEINNPEKRSFQFSAEKKIEWSYLDSNKTSKPLSYNLNLKNLKTAPFNINGFRNLKNEPTEKNFDWGSLKKELLGMDSLEEKKWGLKEYALPTPKISRVELPDIYLGSSNGLMQFVDEKSQLGTAITDIIEDKEGFKWIASNTGLSKYTGDQIYTYDIFNQEGNVNERIINKMVIDNSGRIWIATAGFGIFIIDSEKGVILKDDLNDNFWDILFDHKGHVWAGSAEGLFMINPEELTYKVIKGEKDPLYDNYPFVLKEDVDFNIWVGHDNNVSIIDSSLTFRRRIGEKEGLNVETVVKLHESSDGRMYLGNFAKGLSSISLRANNIQHLNHKNGFNSSALDIIVDSENRGWLFQNDSIFVYKTDKKQLKSISINAKVENGRLIAHNYLEKNGLLWIGTVDNGILLLDTKGPLPEHFDESSGLVNGKISSIEEDSEGFVWIGTENGLNIINPEKRNVKTLDKANSIVPNMKFISIPDIHEFQKNKIYLSLRSSGFAIIDKTANRITNYNAKQGIPETVMSAIIDKQDNIWFTSNEGIFVYNLRSNYLKKIDKSSGFISKSGGWWDIIDDKLGNYWIGTEEGLAIISPTSNSIKYFTKADGLCSNEVLKLLLDDDGLLWVATIKGISVIDLKKKTITNVGEEEGLFPEDIYDLQENGNQIYAGSSDGLMIIEKPQKGKVNWGIARIGKRDGYAYSDYNQMTATKRRNGEIWWGITPMLTINHQFPELVTIKPKVGITGLSLMDDFFDYQDLLSSESFKVSNDTKSNINDVLIKNKGDIKWNGLSNGFKLPIGLTLPYNKNVIRFSYVNADIKGKDRNTYYYSLEGANMSWSRNTKLTISQNFYNLDHGDYTFKVFTKGFNNVWSEADEFSFIINPPWWHTLWAYFLFGLTFIILLRAYIVFRSRKLTIANKKLEETVARRTIALKNKTSELEASLNNLKSTQAQLIQSEKMASLGELTAGIAHEIQNPLNFVNNFSEVTEELVGELEEEGKKENGERDRGLEKELIHDIKENLQKINRHGNRASSIVKGMLEHSRTSSGKKELTDINALADEYLRLSYHGLRAKNKDFNAEMVTDFYPNLPKIELIPQDIGRVLLNLINNAFQACIERSSDSSTELVEVPLSNIDKASTEESGGRTRRSAASKDYKPTVSISTQLTAKGQLLIAIKDNGPGIPDAIKDKIFQPFFTTKDTGKGTGLGLSLAYDIVKVHGGEIKVNSKLGEGTEFIISLNNSIIK
jgi:signal transduction histidine kinase/ligand-binding sensor domain-containing protein